MIAATGATDPAICLEGPVGEKEPRSDGECRAIGSDYPVAHPRTL